MNEKNNSSLLTPNASLLITLPPRNDTETETFAEHNFSEGVLNFDGQEFIFSNGLHAQAIARWLDNELLSVEISITAQAQAPCARCLKPVNLEISEKLMYLYYLQSADGSEGLDEIEEFDSYMPVEVEYFGRVLDIMPQVEESIFTLLPTKVLCKDDCKGLCPNCGKDLNEGDCGCEIESTDPRLEALKNFKI